MGSQYRNYKGTDSIILLAMIGSKYKFLYVDVDVNGRNGGGGGDGGVRSKYTLNVPTPTVLSSRNIPVPYVCTGDDAFPLSTYMMNPYPQSNLAVKKQIFNLKLSRMRRISKNGFGILANRWRVFRWPFLLETQKVKTVTLEAITFHNWLQEASENGKIYIPKGLTDHENIETGEIFEGSWRADDVQGSWYPTSLSRSRNHLEN